MFSLETCPPFILSNGNVNYTREARDGRYSPGTEIIYSCDEGFLELTENFKNVPECDFQGNLTGPLIRCIGNTIILSYF